VQGSTYLIGVLLAVSSGIANNVGTLLQKKVINDRPIDAKVGRSLLKSPLWMLGLLLQLALGTVFFLFAIDMIGPALTPGLMAAGLIVLAVGAVKLIGEQLKLEEYLGIILMVIAITFLGFSELDTGTHIEDLLNMGDTGFILRICIFTGILSAIALVCHILEKMKTRYKGLYLAIFSGCMFALSNFWVAPLVAVIASVFSGIFLPIQLVFFILAAIILCLTNFLGTLKIQQAFIYGQASNMIPIQQVPIQISPIFVYFAVVLLIPLEVYSIPLMIAGVGLIIVSSFLLAKRQAQLEQIK
jgi:drug/metabolite transporter (DMT)-like permease